MADFLVFIMFFGYNRGDLCFNDVYAYKLSNRKIW